MRIETNNECSQRFSVFSKLFRLACEKCQIFISPWLATRGVLQDGQMHWQPFPRLASATSMSLSVGVCKPNGIRVKSILIPWRYVNNCMSPLK